MAFDFKASLIKVTGGRLYLPVSARVVWFREVNPDWSIITEPLEINHEKQYAVFRATILNADGKVMAMGTKKEDVKGFGDYLEKSETGAVGRALALCGFGTQFSPELDETKHERYADSPQPARNGNFNNRGGAPHPQHRPAVPYAPQQAASPDDALRELSAVISGLRESVFGVGDKSKSDYKAWLKKTRKIESISGQELALIEGVRDDLHKMEQDLAAKQKSATAPTESEDFKAIIQDDPFADDAQIPVPVA